MKDFRMRSKSFTEENNLNCLFLNTFINGLVFNFYMCDKIEGNKKRK